MACLDGIYQAHVVLQQCVLGGLSSDHTEVTAITYGNVRFICTPCLPRALAFQKFQRHVAAPATPLLQLI